MTNDMDIPDSLKRFIRRAINEALASKPVPPPSPAAPPPDLATVAREMAEKAIAQIHGPRIGTLEGRVRELKDGQTTAIPDYSLNAAIKSEPYVQSPDPIYYEAVADATGTAGGWTVALKRVKRDGSLSDSAVTLIAIPTEYESGDPPIKEGDRCIEVESGDGLLSVALIGGESLPSGGLKHQGLAKQSDDDGDYDWDWVRLANTGI